MAGKPYQSCLIPYIDEILAMRLQEPPMPYVQIAALLQEKYQISIQRAAIQKFLKMRARGYKPCRYAGKIARNNRLNIEVKAGKKPQVIQAPKSRNLPIKSDLKPKETAANSSTFDPSKVELSGYSETYNLHRPNNPEELEIYRQYLRKEKIKKQEQQAVQASKHEI